MRLRNTMKFYPVGILLMLSVCCQLAACVGVRQYGVQDSNVESAIMRANDMATMYKNGNFREIEKILLRDLETSKNDMYAQERILYELGSLYSYHILDIERAVQVDKELSVIKSAPGVVSHYRLSHETADNRVLYAKEYRDNFLNIDSATLQEKARKRLLINESLLLGEPKRSTKLHSSAELLEMLQAVKEDITRTYPGTRDRHELQSRLMRIEYELYKAAGKPDNAIKEGYTPLLKGEMKLSDVYLSEIDFLSLADYMDAAYRTGRGDLRLARYALELTYRPYLHMRDSNNRWVYNKLINGRINTLIDGNFEKGSFEEMLYYISLNKSRMILEDKVRRDAKGENVFSSKNDFFDAETGLPREDYFRKKLAIAGNYLDFYMGGRYEKVSASDRTALQRASLEASSSFSTSRSLVVKEKNSAGKNKNADSVDVFRADSLYITLVTPDGIKAARVHDSNKLKKLQQHLETVYQNVAHEGTKENRSLVRRQREDGKGRQDIPELLEITQFKLPDSLIVSPDGWLSKQPMDYLLGKKTVRALNLFSLGTQSKMSELRMVGYFNPTGDLPDAEKELDVIQPLIRDGLYFKRDNASLSNLANPIQRNILHLSMHGLDNASDPGYSKLAFAKSELSARTDDPNALYAKDMASYIQLKDNDLVFTAACQTGLTQKSASNQSEILGILRPLLISNNKNIILTLWAVDSESAGMFVKSFYTNLISTKDIKEAFFSAQKSVREKYGTPYHWAPYYLIQND